MNSELFEKLETACPPELFDDMAELEAKTEDTERILRIARYATLQRLNPSLPAGKEHVLALARGEGQELNFSTELRRVWASRHGNTVGLTRGDIEIAAVEAGEGTYEVYEVLWPFDPEAVAELPPELTIPLPSDGN